MHVNVNIILLLSCNLHAQDAHKQVAYAKTLTSVHYSVLADINGLGQEVRREVSTEEAIPDIWSTHELNTLDGFVVAVVHQLGVFRQLPARNLGDGLVVSLQPQITLNMASAVYKAVVQLCMCCIPMHDDSRLRGAVHSKLE